MYQRQRSIFLDSEVGSHVDILHFVRHSSNLLCHPSLLQRNAVRIAAITYVSGGVMFVGKVFITTITTGIDLMDWCGPTLYALVTACENGN